jgi:hypothetical protein
MVLHAEKLRRSLMADLKFKVAVSTGLWGIARGEELATVVKKLGYALTRGTSAIEIAGDVPHEIDFTQGKELRYIAKKQGLDLNFHGSLTIPFCIPELIQWSEAQDHVHKSIKSAVYGGCKYVNFHSCLNFWVEMVTYVGRRLEIFMCDWEGKFISNLLFKDEKVREYFIKKFTDKYGGMILEPAVMRSIYYRAETEASIKVKKEMPDWQERPKEYAERLAEEHSKLMRELEMEELRKLLKKEGEWYYLGRERGDYVDACKIIAYYLFIRKDPIWKEMVEMYKDVLEKFKYDPENPKWLDNAFDEAEKRGGKDEKDFKEFYYGVIGAKFLQGHLVAAAEWMAEGGEFKGRGLPTIIENELKMINPPNLEKEKKELLEILKNLIIGIETPDARDPTYAGRYMLWHPKQVYVAVKYTREELKKRKNPYWDKIMMIIDFEHISTQGVDPLEELKDLVKKVPNIGEYVVCVHSNRPNPLHSHFPIELGDDVVYELLWILTKAGMGKKHTTYILFERGGFKDPFKQSVTALRLMIHFLQKDVPPKELPPDFYGIAPRGLLAEERQWVGIFQHAMDPLKGLLKIPEEEYTFLGRAAVEAGKRPEEWKREEYR